MATSGAGSIQSSTDNSVQEMEQMQECEQQMTVASMTLSVAQGEMSVMAGAGQGFQQTAGTAGQAAAHGARAS